MSTPVQPSAFQLTEWTLQTVVSQNETTERDVSRCCFDEGEHLHQKRPQFPTVTCKLIKRPSDVLKAERLFLSFDMREALEGPLAVVALEVSKTSHSDYSGTGLCAPPFEWRGSVTAYQRPLLLKHNESNLCAMCLCLLIGTCVLECFLRTLPLHFLLKLK